MKPVVYIETTIVSYLAAKPSRNVVIAGQQRVTAQWWSQRRSAFDVVASEAVAFEAMRGDALAAAKRSAYLANLRYVPLDEAVASLAKRLLSGGGLPAKAAQDAVHVAAATIAKADFLLTWNCRHIANAALRPRIESICKATGFKPPVICTPVELMEAP
ncbi:MAG: type II toxin-antitoxin system VapC family toxin [Tepidisphaera sp.]